MATDYNLRCWRCGKLLGEEVSTPYRFTCDRCKAKTKRSE